MRLAQVTGVIVTAIVVLGTDADVMFAVPLGVFAGALATFFASMAEARLSVPDGAGQASAGMLLSDSSSSRKVG